MGHAPAPNNLSFTLQSQAFYELRHLSEPCCASCPVCDQVCPITNPTAQFLGLPVCGSASVELGMPLLVPGHLPSLLFSLTLSEHGFGGSRLLLFYPSLSGF